MNPPALIPLALGIVMIWLALFGDPLHLWSVISGTTPPAKAGSSGTINGIPANVPVQG